MFHSGTFTQPRQIVNSKPATFSAPLLLMHGEADTISECRATDLWMDKCGSKDKTLKIWSNLYHEVGQR